MTKYKLLLFEKQLLDKFFQHVLFIPGLVALIVRFK